MRVLSSLLLLSLLLALPRELSAQREGRSTVPVEVFFQQVTHLWNQGDVSGLMELAPGSGRMELDTGRGSETVSSRHAAAALRELFAERETAAVRPVRVTLAGGTPPRGFGEFLWGFRVRGIPGTQQRSVYVGAVQDDGRWSISELRIMP